MDDIFYKFCLFFFVFFAIVVSLLLLIGVYSVVKEVFFCEKKKTVEKTDCAHYEQGNEKPDG